MTLLSSLLAQCNVLKKESGFGDDDAGIEEVCSRIIFFLKKKEAILYPIFPPAASKVQMGVAYNTVEIYFYSKVKSLR